MTLTLWLAVHVTVTTRINLFQIGIRLNFKVFILLKCTTNNLKEQKASIL